MSDSQNQGDLNAVNFEEVYATWIAVFKVNPSYTPLAQSFVNNKPDDSVYDLLVSVFHLFRGRLIEGEPALGEKAIVKSLPMVLAIDGRESTKHIVQNFSKVAVVALIDHLKAQMAIGKLSQEELAPRVQSVGHIFNSIQDAVTQDDQKVLRGYKENLSSK